MIKNPVITFNNVIKKYDQQEVLSSISFQVLQQDVIGILGPSGMGKTTMLRLIAGLEKESSGEITTHSNKMAYVFQEPRLLPWKTVLENVVLPLKASGINKQDRIKKAEHYLDAMELSEFIDYYPSQLSGGMKQRVSLARAFAIEPDILLLDEPFSALDNRLRNKLLLALGKQLEQKPMTVLYDSHAPKELEKIANRFFLISSKDAFTEISKEECKNLN